MRVGYSDTTVSTSRSHQIESDRHTLYRQCQIKASTEPNRERVRGECSPECVDTLIGCRRFSGEFPMIWSVSLAVDAVGTQIKIRIIRWLKPNQQLVQWQEPFILIILNLVFDWRLHQEHISWQ